MPCALSRRSICPFPSQVGLRDRPDLGMQSYLYPHRRRLEQAIRLVDWTVFAEVPSAG